MEQEKGCEKIFRDLLINIGKLKTAFCRMGLSNTKYLI